MQIKLRPIPGIHFLRSSRQNNKLGSKQVMWTDDDEWSLSELKGNIYDADDADCSCLSEELSYSLDTSQYPEMIPPHKMYKSALLALPKACVRFDK